ncbi:MAG: PAS domain-containing sensor histidine kinase [Bacteroidota bacterium]|nr:PAS domain-containing sensor histidine kinase [Bacteroidota bacterium]
MQTVESNIQILNNHFELIVNNNPDIICRYNLDKKIVFINDTIKKYSGKDPDFYIGKSIYEFGYSTEFMLKIESALDKCISEKEMCTIELDTTEGNMNGKCFNINFVPIIEKRIDYQEIVGVFSVSRDITAEKLIKKIEQNKLQEQKILSQRLIRKANKLQNFAYIVSHNLRSVTSNISMLLSIYYTLKTFEEKEDIVNKINISVKRLNDTIHDLSETVKINQNINVELEELYFESIFNKVCASISSLISSTEAIIETDFKACEKIIYNKVYLESIFLNLLTNAIKYRNPKKNLFIKVETKKKLGYSVLSFSDNGVGINLQKYGNKIFGLHKTFHGNQDARGVGLFITKNQIESLDGKISVKSKVDEGTTFIIYFKNTNEDESKPN